MITAYDAADALMALVISAVGTINTNTYLVASGQSLTLEAPLESEKTQAQYRRIRVGDHPLIPPGLSLYFVPNQDKDVSRWAPNGSVQELSVNIHAMLQVAPDSGGTVDRSLVELGRRGITQAIRGMLNAAANSQFDVNGGTVYQGRVKSADYVDFVRDIRAGVVVPGVLMEWTGRISISEG